MATKINIRTLLEAGCHFGHQTRRWNPKMKPFIFGERNGIYILDLKQTILDADQAYTFVKNVAKGGNVLFVGTKKQAQESIRDEATRCGMHYVNARWLGGMMTNFRTIRKRIDRMEQLKTMQEDGTFDLLPKKEVVKLELEMAKLDKYLGGVKNMKALPKAMFIVDPHKERIAENKPEVVTLLKIQYRMNDEIMRFSSDWFYGGKVESAPQIKYRSVLDYDHPITWIDTSNEENQITIEGEDAPEDSASTSSSESASSSVSATNQNSDLNFKEQFVGESFGRINKAEAELTLLTLAEYFTKLSKRRVLEERIDVGIISPYRAQVQYLKKLIKKYEFFKPYRRLISVNTVDGFQGQERDVILISLVRSNDEGQIGFLKDLRRMNVAMTRARMKLIILGNKDTMTKHPFYKKLWEYVEAINNYE